jgi:hypothetical protein
MDGSQEKVLEKIVSKLKENVALSEEFLKNESINPIDKKIDDIIQIAKGLVEKHGTNLEVKGSLSLILNGLESLRDHYRYYMSNADRAREDYNTYLYVIETLHNENGKGNGSATSKPSNASKPEKRVEQTSSEKSTYEKPAKKVEQAAANEKNTSEKLAKKVERAHIEKDKASGNDEGQDGEEPKAEALQTMLESTETKTLTNADYRDWWKQKGKEQGQEKSRFRFAFHNKT